jgi:hypothetical protein
MSKGSKRRPEKGNKYQDNWEKIFGKKDAKNSTKVQRTANIRVLHTR